MIMIIQIAVLMCLQLLRALTCRKLLPFVNSLRLRLLSWFRFQLLFLRVLNKNPRLACSLLLVTVKWIIQSKSCKKTYVPLQKATFTTGEGYAPCQKVQTPNASRWDNWKSNTCRCGYHWREVSAVPTASAFELSQHYELSTKSSQQLNWHNPDKSLVRLVGDFRKWKFRLSSGQTGSESLSLTWLLTLGSLFLIHHFGYQQQEVTCSWSKSVTDTASISATCTNVHISKILGPWIPLSHWITRVHHPTMAILNFLVTLQRNFQTPTSHSER